MRKSDKKIIQEIQSKFEFLLYKQGTAGAKYRHVYANGSGAMYYCAGEYAIPTNPTAFLIDDQFKVFYACPWTENANTVNKQDILQVINRNGEIISPKQVFFDTVRLNPDNSFVMGRKDNNVYEFDAEFKERSPSAFNEPKNASQLPNGMTVQFAWDDPFIRTIEDTPRNEILSDIKSVQNLSASNIVIWQKTSKIDDVYIIDFNAKPYHYTTALNDCGNDELNQKLVNDYKKRYMNVANLLLCRQNQK